MFKKKFYFSIQKLKFNLSPHLAIQFTPKINLFDKDNQFVKLTAS